jgi:hypothetical protein
MLTQQLIMDNNKDSTSTRMQVQEIKTRARPGQKKAKVSRHDNLFKIMVKLKKINI